MGGKGNKRVSARFYSRLLSSNDDSMTVFFDMATHLETQLCCSLAEKSIPRGYRSVQQRVREANDKPCARWEPGPLPQRTRGAGQGGMDAQDALPGSEVRFAPPRILSMCTWVLRLPNAEILYVEAAYAFHICNSIHPVAVLRAFHRLFVLAFFLSRLFKRSPLLLRCTTLDLAPSIIDQQQQETGFESRKQAGRRGPHDRGHSRPRLPGSWRSKIPWEAGALRDTFLGSAAGCATANTTYAQENAVEFPRIQENRRAWPSQVTLIVTFKKFSTP